jgi:hypothetical protein
MPRPRQVSLCPAGPRLVDRFFRTAASRDLCGNEVSGSRLGSSRRGRLYGNVPIRAIMGTLGLCPLGLRCTAPLVRSARRGAHKQSRARRCALAAQTRGLHAPRPDARETRGAGLGTPGRRRRAPGDVGVSQRSCLQSRNSQPSIGHSESVASGARVGGQADELAALFPEPLCEFGVPGLGAGSHYLLVFDVLAGESSGVVGEREPDQRAGAALRGA